MTSMTLPPITQQPEDQDFEERNAELFAERAVLVDALAELNLVESPDASVRRHVRKSARRLDDVNAELVILNIGLVRGYVKKFSAGADSAAVQDFEAAGLVGLMKGIDSYDPEKGKFAGWVYRYIKREVLVAVRDSDFKNLGRGDFEVRPAILLAVETLHVANPGSVPSDAEIAEEAGVTKGQVRRVLQAPTLESMHGRADSDGDEPSMGETLDSGDLDVAAAVVTAGVLDALATYGLGALSHREAYVVVRRFGLDSKPAEKLLEIGESMGLSREAVRQIESKAMAKLNHPVILRRIVRQGRK